MGTHSYTRGSRTSRKQRPKSMPPVPIMDETRFELRPFSFLYQVVIREPFLFRSLLLSLRLLSDPSRRKVVLPSHLPSSFSPRISYSLLSRVPKQPLRHSVFFFTTTCVKSSFPENANARYLVIDLHGPNQTSSLRHKPP